MRRILSSRPGDGDTTRARGVADSRLLTKRGGPVTAEDAARLQECLCPLGTILDACRRLAHLGQAYAYA